jgi:hypothetical protein
MADQAVEPALALIAVGDQASPVMLVVLLEPSGAVGSKPATGEARRFTARRIPPLPRAHAARPRTEGSSEGRG